MACRVRFRSSHLIGAAVAALAIVLDGRSAPAEDLAYTPVDYPSAGAATDIRGFSGGRAVGHYFLPNGINHGFLYNGSSFTDLDYPPGPGVGQTFPTDIEGSVVVGYYLSGPKGFQHNTATPSFAPLSHPSGSGEQPEGTDGTRVVGHRNFSSGFVYDGATWTDQNYPGAGFTNVTGIEGQTIVGYYTAAGDPNFTPHGFTHVLGSATWTPLDFPGAVSTQVWDIDGGRIVGQYSTDTRLFGFVLEGGTWTSLNIPGSISTSVTAIDGNQIAGNYFINPARQQSFIASIPEPSSAAVLLVSWAALADNRRRGRSGSER